MLLGISWNSAYVWFESGLLMDESMDASRDATAPNTTLTPIGQMQSDIRATMQQLGGSLGVHQAPVAFLLDPFAGWMPPRSLRSHHSQSISYVRSATPYLETSTCKPHRRLRTFRVILLPHYDIPRLFQLDFDFGTATGAWACFITSTTNTINGKRKRLVMPRKL